MEGAFALTLKPSSGIISLTVRQDRAFALSGNLCKQILPFACLDQLEQTHGSEMLNQTHPRRNMNTWIAVAQAGEQNDPTFVANMLYCALLNRRTDFTQLNSIS